MIPAAVTKADSLTRYCKERGSPLNEVVLTLTKSEGYELLDYIESGGMGTFQHHELLIADIAVARISADPWVVLEHFQLQGLTIARMDDLH